MASNQDTEERLKAALADRYTIEREIGSGGMATVYLAQDLKHDRKVAVKVLRPELTAVVGAERFLAEIKTTANLQHPHILPLFDSGEADGFLFYVMPYVEGETLRDKLNREKELSIQEAVDISTAVANALDYAHRQDVIHRDIKPANILIHDGNPVVADFGIALALSAAGGEQLTETGLSIGTPLYMSPEQATGDRDLDGRSDEYSLACVTYEMLAGVTPFTGATAQAVLAQKMSRDTPSVTALRPSVPAPMAMVLETALASIPADRFPTVTEFVRALSDPSRAGPYLPQPHKSAVVRIGPAGWSPWAIAAIAVAALVWTLAHNRTSTVHTLHADIVLEDPEGAPATSLDISPDGSLIAYVAGPNAQLYLRPLNELTATLLPGTEGAFDPSFSPDGQSVAFSGPAREQIRRIAVAGGPPVNVTDQANTNYRKLDWGEDGYIYFTHLDGTLARVRAEGGAVERLTELSSNLEGSHQAPDVLPGGRGVLFTIYRWPAFRNDIAVLDLKSRDVQILRRGVYARYAPSGHLVAVQDDGTILATPFDARRLELEGAPVAMGQALVRSNVPSFIGTQEISLSSNGTLLYWAGSGRSGIVLVDRVGNRRWLGTRTAHALNPVVSPEGQRIATSIPGANSIGIWVYGLADETFSPLTFEHDDIYPAWSADGRSVLFARAPVGGPGGDYTFHRIPADGSGEAEPLFDKEGSQVEILETPDGRWLIYREGDLARGAGASIFYVDASGEGERRPLAPSGFHETSPAISPDGRWLAYVSDESGRREVYVQAFPGTGAHHRVSTDGGTEPVWARDGAALYYRSGDFLMVAEVDAAPSFMVTNRERLLSTSLLDEAVSHRGYDVLPGDRQFVFVAGAERVQLVLVLNWFEELNDRIGR